MVPRKKRCQNGDEVEFGIMPVIADSGGNGRDSPGFCRKSINMILQPMRCQHHKGQHQRQNRQQTEQGRSQGTEMKDQHRTLLKLVSHDGQHGKEKRQRQRLLITIEA